MSASLKKLYVHSIFASISGEVGAIPQGALTTFVRLSGCNLQCPYCDTPDTQNVSSGTKLTVARVVREIKKGVCTNVLITGGEPLMQSETASLLEALVNEKTVRQIQVETNGTMTPPVLSNKICYVFDYKLHASESMLPESLLCQTGLKANGYIKFVVGDVGDLQDVNNIINRIVLLAEMRGITAEKLPKFAVGNSNPEGLPHNIVIDQIFKMRKTLSLQMTLPIYNVQLHKLVDVQ